MQPTLYWGNGNDKGYDRGNNRDNDGSDGVGGKAAVGEWESRAVRGLCQHLLFHGSHM